MEEKYYEVEIYQLYTVKHRVKASSPELAVAKVNDNLGTEVDESLEYIGRGDNDCAGLDGMTCPLDRKKLASFGVETNNYPGVPGIRNVEESDDQTDGF